MKFSTFLKVFFGIVGIIILLFLLYVIVNGAAYDGTMDANSLISGAGFLQSCSFSNHSLL